MAFQIDQLVETLPASGAIGFDDWKSQAQETLGGRLGNRDMNALRRDSRVTFFIDTETGQHMVSRNGTGG